MKKNIGMFLLAALVVAALLLSTIAFTVDELKDIVVVKTFGRVTSVYEGAKDAGLKFKWPWPIQRLLRYDARTFTLEDPPYAELQTRDQQNILITMYCTWRIKDPEKFHRTIVTEAKATKNIRDRLSAHKNNVLGRYTLDSLVNTDPAKMKIAQIEQEVLEPLRQEMSDQYGVEIRSVGMKALGLPQVVSNAVIEMQKTEREEFVQQYKAAGEALATAIRARADRASKQILAFAAGKAMKIRAEGDSAAAKYYRKYAANERLGMFLRTLESLRALKDNTQIVLDGTQLPGADYFRDGPSLPKLPSTMPTGQGAKKPPKALRAAEAGGK